MILCVLFTLVLDRFYCSRVQYLTLTTEHAMSTDYTVLEDTNSDNLATRVKVLLEDGWKLAGGVSITAVSRSTQVYQDQHRHHDVIVSAQALIKDMP